jgi:xylulokinase
LLAGVDALARGGVTLAADGRLVLVGGGAQSAAYRKVLADLAGVPVRVPNGAEQVATGACVQAAAVLHGRTPAEVAEAWALDEGEDTPPSARVDRAAIRARYAQRRDEET